MANLFLICCFCGLLALGSARVFDRVKAFCAGGNPAGWDQGPGRAGAAVPAAPAAVVSVETPAAEVFCLCNQCELAPACASTFPECVRGAGQGRG